MLKGIPSILSPELMKVLLEMGHGDEIVLADGNFPSASCAQKLVRCDGHNVSEMLDAILKFFPLDSYSEFPASLMEVVSGDHPKPVIWNEYKSIIQEYEDSFSDFEIVERYEFYKRAKHAFAIIATSEREQYANVILKKGVIRG
ncbi:L-fucose mutarotase [Bacillus pakistanensis]|uniref:L-fucose mutarotase n=1 Tax=Rossellomorea pakistanensis TaxID=992288 RepID=A0ABS2NCJ4_9BACI|nr:RbsD/FucU domain-containing protein [Bacillus pakistanensis]MBM7585535.1 L-fucose mutarotase [Bacillus pakistanensis]